MLKPRNSYQHLPQAFGTSSIHSYVGEYKLLQILKLVTIIIERLKHILYRCIRKFIGVWILKYELFYHYQSITGNQIVRNEIVRLWSKTVSHYSKGLKAKSFLNSFENIDDSIIFKRIINYV